MKYLLFGNNTAAAGFGNQLRAFVGTYIWSKILNREFITNNYWVTNYFNTPIKSKYNVKLSKKLCLHDKIFLLNDIKDNVKKDAKNSVSFNIVEPYSAIQFRSFYDAAFKNRKYLNEFLNIFISKVNSKIPVFVTTDSNEMTNKIIDFLLNKKFNVFSSGLKNSHTARNRNINPIIDWYIMGQSDYLFSTGTTFSLSSAGLFNTRHFIFKKNKNIIGDIENIGKKYFWL